MALRLLRIDEVLAGRGVKRAKHYNDIRAGTYTAPIKLGHLSVWPEHEHDAITTAIIAGATVEELIALVARLHAARTAPQGRPHDDP